jgi:hypothetical protein
MFPVTNGEIKVMKRNVFYLFIYYYYYYYFKALPRGVKKTWKHANAIRRKRRSLLWCTAEILALGPRHETKAWPSHDRTIKNGWRVMP